MTKMIIRLLAVLLSISALAAISSCRNTVDDLDKLVKGRGKSGTGDEAITILEENKKMGETSKQDSTNMILDSEPRGIQPEKGLAAAVDLPKEKPSVKTNASVPASKKKYVSASEIVKMNRAHQYENILKASVDPKDANSLYYQANAHFVLAMQTKAGLAKDKHISAAEKLFKTTGAMQTEKVAKARSYLWMGITGYYYRTGVYDSETISKPLRFLAEKLSDTPYYNDALMYLGLIQIKANNPETAKSYFDLLAKTDPRDRVYDIDYKRWSDPQTAAKHYLTLIKTSKDTADSMSEPLIPLSSTNSMNAATPVDKAEKIPLNPPLKSSVNTPVKDDFMDKVEKIHKEIIGGQKPSTEAAPTGKETSNGSAQVPSTDGKVSEKEIKSPGTAALIINNDNFDGDLNQGK